MKMPTASRMWRFSAVSALGIVVQLAAIWVLTIGFVVLLFLRQGKLKAEIERLHRELGKAIKDDK